MSARPYPQSLVGAQEVFVELMSCRSVDWKRLSGPLASSHITRGAGNETSGASHEWPPTVMAMLGALVTCNAPLWGDGGGRGQSSDKRREALGVSLH